VRNVGSRQPRSIPILQVREPSGNTDRCHAHLNLSFLFSETKGFLITIITNRLSNCHFHFTTWACRTVDGQPVRPKKPKLQSVALLTWLLFAAQIIGIISCTMDWVAFLVAPSSIRRPSVVWLILLRVLTIISPF